MISKRTKNQDINNQKLNILNPFKPLSTDNNEPVQHLHQTARLYHRY